MTQYVRHALEAALGSVPAWCAALWGGVGNFTAGQSPAKYLGDRALQVNLSPIAGLRFAAKLTEVSADAQAADVEVLVRISDQLTGTGSRLSIGARCSGTSTSWTGYFASVNLGSGTASIEKGVAGADTTLGSAAFAPTGPYFIRFRVNGTTLEAKFWNDDGSAEPVAWTITATDSAIGAAGAVTVGGRTTTNGAYQYYAHFVAAGTGGDGAPARPVTWQEYLDFLATQDALICVLLEVDVLGQDASGNAVTGRVCMSNFPFVSKPWDPYPNICYEEILQQAVRLDRKMSESFTGQTSISYGDAIIKNEVSNDDLSGRLDAWLSWNWDGRTARQLVGHPAWRRCDFKTEFAGVIQNIYKAGYGQLGLKFWGPEALMQRPLSTATIGGAGPNAAALLPIGIGEFFNAEAKVYGASGLVYVVNSANVGGIGFGVYDQADIRDSGISLTQPTRTVNAVDAANDLITFDAAHGGLAGAELWFISGTPPAPLSLNTQYFMSATGLTTTACKLSTTPSGPVVDITGTTTGAKVKIRLSQYDDGTGHITLLSAPAGRVTVDYLSSFTQRKPKDVIVGALQLAGISGSTFGDLSSFDLYHGVAPQQRLGYYTQAQKALGDVINEVCASVGASWCRTREGAAYLTVLDIPGSAAAWTVVADEITNWRQGAVFLPREVERLGVFPNQTVQQGGDLANGVSVANRDLYGRPYTLVSYSQSESGLDQPANHPLRTTPPERPTLMLGQADGAAESGRLYRLWRKVCATYIFQTTAQALAWELGDVVNITYQRDGFSGGKNAIVVEINETADRGRADVTVFCQVDGQWPVVPNASSNPFLSEAYY